VIKKSLSLFLVLYFALIFNSDFLQAKQLPCTPWVPYGDLKEIPFYEDCDVTQGDMAIARTNGIYWCPEVAERLDKQSPGISHFIYVHEYGHYVKGNDELATDCWAAQELKNTCYIPAAIYFFLKHGNVYKENYGYMRDRAKMIQKCSSE